MRSRKAALNIISAAVLQIVTIICGFIVPRLIISNYGSAVNGVMSSISQFLGYIALAEAGVGGVVRAALYSPLANNDNVRLSGIIKATERFFRVIAIVFIGYALIIAASFPLLQDSGMDWSLTFSLVLIIAMSTFVEYYFGITNLVLLHADQKLYITSTLRIITAVLHLLLVYVLIRLGRSVHTLRFFSALVFMIRPFVLRIYVRKRYRIDQHCQPDNNALKQKWDGLGQHIAYFLHSHTDVVVLTLFTNFIEVSVYSVHYLVASGIQKITMIFTSGFEAAFGNMLAKQETKALNRTFRIYELISSSVTIILFTTAGLLINPFITLYTRGVTDADYHRGVFAYILLLAEAVYCIRQPYHSIIIAAGHFRQTNKYAFLEAGINICLSIILVIRYGLLGVAIATLVAVTYRTAFCAVYLQRNILYRSAKAFLVRQIVTIANSALIVITVRFSFQITSIQSYKTWCITGALVMVIACAITLLFDLVFYRKDVSETHIIIKNLLSSIKAS